MVGWQKIWKWLRWQIEYESEWPVGPQRQRGEVRGGRGQEWLSRFSRKRRWILSRGSLHKNIVLRYHFQVWFKGNNLNVILLWGPIDWGTNCQRDLFSRKSSAETSWEFCNKANLHLELHPKWWAQEFADVASGLSCVVDANYKLPSPQSRTGEHFAYNLRMLQAAWAVLCVYGNFAVFSPFHQLFNSQIEGFAKGNLIL